MNRRQWVFPLAAEDLQKFAEWETSNPINGFDPDIMFYAATEKFVAKSEGEPVVFMPHQTVLMLESLAVNPEAKPEHIGIAMKALTANAVTLAASRGIGEIYFLGTHDGTNAAAVKQGFELVKLPVYRLKLSDLHKKRVLENEDTNKSSH